MQPIRPGTHGPLVLLVVSCLVTAVAVVAGLAGAGPAVRPGDGARAGTPPGTGAESSSVRLEARAAVLLHAWDVRRARAWAQGDVAGLRSLYVPGSGAGERDASMLRAWLRRGLRVRGLSTQLLAVRVVSRTPRRLVLDVTDRIVSGSATRSGAAPVALPVDLPSQRVLVLERSVAGWQVAAVRDRPG